MPALLPGPGDGRFKVLPNLAGTRASPDSMYWNWPRRHMSGMDVILSELVDLFSSLARREILNRLAERLAPGGCCGREVRKWRLAASGVDCRWPTSRCWRLPTRIGQKSQVYEWSGYG